MGFSAYWKEVAVVLAGLFAIGGLLSEAKDKITGKFTAWGRVFFTLTILSTMGGIYAQWSDSAEQEKRSKQAQVETLNLLERTQKSVYDLSRLLQPIEKVQVNLFYKLDCAAIKLKAFCSSVRSQAKVQERIEPPAIRGRGVFSVRKVDWSKWPGGSTFFDFVTLYFFKNRNDADEFLKKQNAMDDDGDMSLELVLQPQPRLLLNRGDDLSVEFDARNGDIEFMVIGSQITPKINDDKMLSAVDIPGATMVLMNRSPWLSSYLIPDSALLTTARGQTIETDSFEPITVHFADFDLQPLRPPRRPLLSRRRVRAEGLFRE